MDRNQVAVHFVTLSALSLSARRAWIEMFLSMGLDGRFKVALRKESVDRNGYFGCNRQNWVMSLSARRAWIEIARARIQYCPQPSLSARRAWIEIDAPSSAPYAELSLSARRAWIEIALLAESDSVNRSLSARRAWIEIAQTG